MKKTMLFMLCLLLTQSVFARVAGPIAVDDYPSRPLRPAPSAPTRVQPVRGKFYIVYMSNYDHKLKRWLSTSARPTPHNVYRNQGARSREEAIRIALDESRTYWPSSRHTLRIVRVEERN